MNNNNMNSDEKRAIISVSDKSYILDVVEFLTVNDYRIYSTGGTYKFIKDNIPTCNLFKISDLTGFPEILNGRVKTLHPHIYGGLLADCENNQHKEEMDSLNLPFFKIVIVNLYPFERVSNSNSSFAECIENIDIGGVSLIRASAKNFKNIVLLSDPQQYNFFIQNYRDTSDLGIDFIERKNLAIDGFQHTSKYDSLITKYLSNNITIDNSNKNVDKGINNKIKLKYGLNPQQQNSYLSFINERGAFEIINGILGYINVLDILNGWLTVMEVDDTLKFPTVISMKHTSLAGLAIGNGISDNTLNYFSSKMEDNICYSDLAKAFMKARTADPLSSFGDFICLSRKVDIDTALLIKREVCDGVAAPDFAPEALEILKQKKGGKFIIAKMDLDYYNKQKSKGWTETRTMYGVTLEQENNKANVNLNDIPNTFSKEDLILANIALKYAQSNNISICCDGQIIGMGCGQQNRVNCVNLAGVKALNWLNRQTTLANNYWNSLDSGLKRQAKVNLLYAYIDENPLLFEKERSKLETNRNIVLASDGFFPFSDNIDCAHKYGITEIIQPGGSIADDEVIRKCNEYGIKMFLSGSMNRMFFH